MNLLIELGILRRTPIAVEPSLIASREYSTWNKRPSGEKVLLRDSSSDHGGKQSNVIQYVFVLNSTVC